MASHQISSSASLQQPSLQQLAIPSARRAQARGWLQQPTCSTREELPNEHLAAYAPLINELLIKWRGDDASAPEDLRAHYTGMAELVASSLVAHDSFYADCFKQLVPYVGKLVMHLERIGPHLTSPLKFLTAEDKEDKTNDKPDLILRRGRNCEWRMIVEVVKSEDSLFKNLERALEAEGHV